MANGTFVAQPLVGSGVRPPGGAATGNYGWLTEAFPTDPAVASLNSANNPFVGSAVQTARVKAHCQVTVEGQDVTSAIAPFLVSVHIVDGVPDNQCEIELDDRDGRLNIPANGSPVSVQIGWESEALIKTYNGTINDVEHGFGRKQGGRRMWVKAAGGNFAQAIKSNTMQVSMGQGQPPGQQQGQQITLQSFISSIAKTAGITALVDPKLGAITRDHWAAVNESIIHKAQSLAHEFGAVFRMQNGNQLMMTLPGNSSAPTIICKWAENLIAYRVRPMAARSSWGGAQQQYFDHDLGAWKSVIQSFGLQMPWGAADARHQRPMPAPNAAIAGQQNSGAQSSAQSYSSDGTIVINGEPLATATGTATIVNVRPGVDGDYFIYQAHHVWSRQGYVTRLHVAANGSGSVGGGFRQPGPGAGPPVRN